METISSSHSIPVHTIHVSNFKSNIAYNYTYSNKAFNHIRSGVFQTANNSGGGALKVPLPLRFQKLFPSF